MIINESTILSVEQTILGTLLTNDEAWDLVADKLDEKKFILEEHKHIFHAMKRISSSEKKINLLTIEHELISANKLKDVGGMYYIASLAKDPCTLITLTSYADEIDRQHGLRCLKDLSLEIELIAGQSSLKTADEIIAHVEHKIFKIQEGSLKKSGPMWASEIFSEFLDEMEKVNPNTLSTGFQDLDYLFNGGMRPGELIIIAGRPGMGKSTLAVNIAEHVSVKLKKGVLIFSLEMGSVDVIRRMVSSIARIEHKYLRRRNHTNNFTDKEWAQISNVSALFSENTIKIDQTPRIPCSEFRSKCRREARLNKNLSLIIVDYLQLMETDSFFENKVNKIAEITATLKAVAKELNIPVIACAQLNRDSVRRVGDKKPNMADLRDSGAIEQDSDIVALIYREDALNKSGPPTGMSELIIDKNRNGETGVVNLIFSGAFSKFLNAMGTV